MHKFWTEFFRLFFSFIPKAHGCFLFDNSDPKIIIEEVPQGRRQIEVSYKISILEEGTAAMLMDKLNAKGRVKERIRKLIKG